MLPFYCLFVVLLSLSIWYYKNAKGALLLLVLVIYTISSFFSIIFVESDYFSGRWLQKYDFTFYPFVIWMIYLAVLCEPLKCYDSLSIKRLGYSESFLDFICLVGLAISIIPLFELFPQLYSIFNASNLSITLSDIHDTDEKMINFSLLGRICFGFIRYTYELYIICIIPVFLSRQRKRLRILSLLLIITTHTLATLITSSRGAILTTIMNLLLVYCIALPFLRREQKIKIRKILVVLISIPIVVFIIITISRSVVYNYNERDKTLLAFIYSYAGEGFVNFNQYIPHIREHVDGDYCFFVFRKMFGLNEFREITRDVLRNAVQNKLGIPMMKFYTFIGFFVMDIGYIGTFVFFLLLSYVMKKSIAHKKKVFPLHTLYLLMAYSSVIVNGTCLYKYTWDSSVYLIVIPLLYFSLKLYHKSYVEKR